MKIKPEGEKTAKAEAPAGPNRKRRRSRLDGGRMRLYVPEKDKDPNYHYGWVVDHRGKCEELIDMGYEFVNRKDVSHIGDADVHNDNSDLGSRVSRVVGIDEAGQPLRQYLMRQHMDFYNEDRAARRAEMDKVDEALHSSEVENVYGEIRVSRS